MYPVKGKLPWRLLQDVYKVPEEDIEMVLRGVCDDLAVPFSLNLCDTMICESEPDRIDLVFDILMYNQSLF